MIEIDYVQEDALLDGRLVGLTPTQWIVFRRLWERSPGYYAGEPHETNVRWHINNLRKKLGHGAISNRRGFGWKLERS